MEAAGEILGEEGREWRRGKRAQKGAQQRGEEGEGVQPVLRDRCLQPETGSPARPAGRWPLTHRAGRRAVGPLGNFQV